MIAPSAVLFNGGVFKAAELRRGWSRSSLPGRERAGPCSRNDRSRPRRGLGCGLLRPGPPGQGRPDSRRRAALVLRRNRDRRHRRSPESRRRSRRSAWFRWGWRKGPSPTCPGPSSAWSSANRLSFDSLDRPPVETTDLVLWSTAGRRMRFRSSTRLKPLSTRPKASPTRWYPCDCTRFSTRSARWNSGARASKTRGAGSSNSTCGRHAGA